jgi:nitrous oxide reductase
MKSETKSKLGRRDFLRALGAGAGVAAVTAAPIASPAVADTESSDEKRKARYKADSAEVQTYYRVNGYPK